MQYIYVVFSKSISHKLPKVTFLWQYLIIRTGFVSYFAQTDGGYASKDERISRMEGLLAGFHFKQRRIASQSVGYSCQYSEGYSVWVGISFCMKISSSIPNIAKSTIPPFDLEYGFSVVEFVVRKPDYTRKGEKRSTYCQLQWSRSSWPMTRRQFDHSRVGSGYALDSTIYNSPHFRPFPFVQNRTARRCLIVWRIQIQ